MESRGSCRGAGTGGLACWFRSDIAYGVCVHDDKPDRDSVLKLAFYGSGALPEPMSDFNDVAFIERVGLSHSITVVTPQTEAVTLDLPGERGHALRPVPAASLRLLSIAPYVDGAPVYNAAGCAFTARFPLAKPYRFGSRRRARPGTTCVLEASRRTRST